VLIEKQRPHEAPVAIDFLGARVEDHFLVGYGLDYRDQFRELPFIARLDPPTNNESPR
jgi:hypoxanthine phosphoribosyltransferase